VGIGSGSCSLDAVAPERKGELDTHGSLVSKYNPDVGYCLGYQ